MACPICEKRKAKRFCPAKAETICTVCCGTEREVTIDCPSDCPYLVESRRHAIDPRGVDPASLPFADRKIPSSFVIAHERLILALSYAICLQARDKPAITDADVTFALRVLGEAYQTLSNGIYYEQPPEYALQLGLYTALKEAIEGFKKTSAQRGEMATMYDSEIRDAVIFLAQLGVTRANGRPKSRAYLDFLRGQFKSDEFRRPSAGLLVVP